MRKFKIVLLGNSGVGKSSLVFYAQNGTHKTDIDSTVGCEFQARNVTLENQETVRMLIWDTAGQEVFRAFAPNFLRNCKAAIVCYDVTDMKSFESVTEWAKLALDEQAQLIIVGNKCDQIQRRVVSRFVGESRADELNAHAFVETSAVTGEGVDTIFEKTAEAVVQVQSNEVVSPDDTVSLSDIHDETPCCNIF